MRRRSRQGLSWLPAGQRDILDMDELELIRRLGVPDEIVGPEDRLQRTAWICFTCGKTTTGHKPISGPAPCRRCGGITRERAQQMAGHHGASLRTLGTRAHLGTVPAAALTRVAVVDPAKAPELCYYVRINPVTVLNFRDVGGQLRWLTEWVFGDAPKWFEGPAESDRAGITIMTPPITARALEILAE